MIPVIYSFMHYLFPQIESMTLGTIHKYRVKIGNNVSEFTYSNWMTKYYRFTIISNKLSPLSNSTSALLEF